VLDWACICVVWCCFLIKREIGVAASARESRDARAAWARETNLMCQDSCWQYCMRHIISRVLPPPELSENVSILSAIYWLFSCWWLVLLGSASLSYSQRRVSLLSDNIILETSSKMLLSRHNKFKYNFYRPMTGVCVVLCVFARCLRRSFFSANIAKPVEWPAGFQP